MGECNGGRKGGADLRVFFLNVPVPTTKQITDARLVGKQNFVICKAANQASNVYEKSVGNPYVTGVGWLRDTTANFITRAPDGQTLIEPGLVSFDNTTGTVALKNEYGTTRYFYGNYIVIAW